MADEKYTLFLLSSGCTRDVLGCTEDSQEVIKRIAASDEWCNRSEHRIAQAGLAPKLVTKVFGCVECLHAGRNVSVMLAERMDTNLSDTMTSLYTKPGSVPNLEALMKIVGGLVQIWSDAAKSEPDRVTVTCPISAFLAMGMSSLWTLKHGCSKKTKLQPNE